MSGIIFAIGVAMLIVPIWALIDAITRPTGAFVAAGSSKGMWIALILLFSIFTGVIGLVLSIVYLASIRPRVRAITR